MSEVQSPEAGGLNESVPARDPIAAGKKIKQLREAAGLHVVALAAALKVPVKKLEALEAGRMDQLPDATFARALAGSVCRQLKVDSSDVLALLPKAAGSRLGEDQSLNATFRSPRDPSGAEGHTPGVPRAVWIALFILLVAALVWWAVPPKADDVPLATPAEPLLPVAPTEGATSMGSGANVSEETAAAPSDVPTPAADSAPATGTATAPAAQVTQPVSIAPAGSSATGAASATAPASADVLVIRASADSWVEVSAGGKVLLQRVVKTGESVALGDTPPLAVVIGRVDATEVLVRGKPFDLAAVARNNVARFEVK